MTLKQTPLLLLLLCLLTAAALRLIGLADPLPPLHIDEAVNGLLVAEPGRLAAPTAVYAEHGLDALFLYAAAGLTGLIGPTPFGLRLTAVFLSLLTVAAAYPLGRALRLPRGAALLAVGLLAVSFWPLLIGRYGLGGVVPPLIISAALLTLLHGWRRRSLPWLAAAAPFLVLLIAHFGRQFAGSPEPAFAAAYGRALALLFLSGDPDWGFNLPGLPLFNWFWGGLMVIGAIFLAQKSGEARRPLTLTAVAFLLLFPFVALLPVALNEGGAANRLAVGLIPLIYYLPAYGLFGLLQKLAARRADPTAGLNRLASASLIIILVMAGLPTAWSYFGLWRPSAELFAANEGDLAAVARYLDENPPLVGERLFVAAARPPHPTIQFLSTGETAGKAARNWLPSGEALVWPGDGAARVVYPRSAPHPDWARPFLADAPQEAGPPGPDGEPQYIVYRLNEPPGAAPPHILNADFGQMATLIGYQAGGGAAGEGLPLLLYWRVERPLPAGFQPTVALTDENGRVWSQTTFSAYAANQWRAGDLILQRELAVIPAGTPPGYYWLRVSLRDSAAAVYLPVWDELGRFAGDAAAMQSGAIAASAAPLAAPPVPLRDKRTPGLQLLGYERSAAVAYAGQRLDLALWWRATAPLSPMTIRLELMRPNGAGIILHNSQPVDGRYPFEQWRTSQFIIDWQSPRLPADLAAGPYQLQLRLLDAADRTLFTADLGSLEVAASERQFATPPPQFPQAALFGDTIRLVGYDWRPLAAGEWELDLIWQATRETAVGYTAVVQWRDLDNSCCLWQQENRLEPVGPSWLAGEIIRDRYRLTPPPDLPSGFYPLGVQLSIAATGQPLLVVVPGLPDDDTAWLRPLRVD